MFEFVDKTLLEILEGRTNGLDVSIKPIMPRPIVRECSEVHLSAVEGDQLLSLGNSYSQRYQA